MKLVHLQDTAVLSIRPPHAVLMFHLQAHEQVTNPIDLFSGDFLEYIQVASILSKILYPSHSPLLLRLLGKSVGNV